MDVVDTPLRLPLAEASLSDFRWLIRRKNRIDVFGSSQLVATIQDSSLPWKCAVLSSADGVWHVHKRMFKPTTITDTADAEVYGSFDVVDQSVDHLSSQLTRESTLRERMSITRRTMKQLYERRGKLWAYNERFYRIVRYRQLSCYVWMTDTNEEIIRYMLPKFYQRSVGFIEVTSIGRSLPELPWMVLFGVYRVVGDVDEG
jgi:hypothetical protein